VPALLIYGVDVDTNPYKCAGGFTDPHLKLSDLEQIPVTWTHSRHV
jgi:hypothetical protein